MSGPARRLAARLVSAASLLLPPHLSPWGRAMACELRAIADDRAALAFAAGCLRAAFALAVAARLRPLSLPPSTWSIPTMNGISERPRLLGLICGAAAVALGLAYLLAAGAPPRFPLVNLGAFALGAAAWLALGRAGERLAAGPAVLALALAILLTAAFGVAADGARRWVDVGPLSLQVSLIALPVMIVLHARRPDAIGTAGMVVAAAALAIQPDRAMAGALLAALLVMLAAAPGRLAIVAAAAAALAFGWTLVVPDTLPASLHVDGILYTAFDVHLLAGLAVAAGLLSLLLPAAIGALRESSERPAFLAFGACWLGVVVAAALDNYPAPLVGYGGSAVVGYLLSVALLPSGARERGRAGASAAGRSAQGPDSQVRLAALHESEAAAISLR